MRISQLAATTGVPLATVKFYLREGLLPPGRRTSATQAVYADEHVARLRLVRALVETGGLSLQRTRAVLAGLDSTDVFEAVGCAHGALSPDRDDLADPVDTAAAEAVVRAAGWDVGPGTPALVDLAVAMARLEEVGIAMSAEQLATYAAAADQVATADVTSVPTDSVTSAVTTVVLGTVLREPVLLALRRLAQQSHARSTWAAASVGPSPSGRTRARSPRG